MSNQPQPVSCLDEIKQILVDFGLPALIIIVSMVLLLTGVDGEIKTVLALAAGWMFKSGYTKAKK